MLSRIHQGHEGIVKCQLKIGTDLFELKSKSYLSLVDYFSRYIEVVKLISTTTNSVVAAMKPLLARYGIPDVIISDKSPQYSS